MSIDRKTEHAIISVIYNHARFKYITSLHETEASIILTANQYCYQELKSKESKNKREEKKGLKNKKQQKKELNDTAS